MKALFKKGIGHPIAVFASVAILILFFVLIGQVLPRSLYEGAFYLDGGWELTLNGEVRQEVDMSKYVFPTLDRGDQITLRTILPDVPFDSTHLQMRIWHSTINVRVDGEEIFSYGSEALSAAKAVGGGYQWFAIPSDVGGKMIEFQLVATENDSFTQFAPPMLYSSAEMVEDFIRQNSPMSISGLFLVALGLILLLLSAIVLTARRDSLQLLWIALLSLDVGLWVLCRYGIFQLVCSNAQVNYYIEYLCLYLTTPLGLLSIYAIRDNQSKKSLATTVFIGLHLVYVPILIILHQLKILYIAEALRIGHIFILAASIFIFCYCFRQRHNTAERVKLLGVTVLATFAMLDLLLFVWDNAVPRGYQGVRYSMAAIGSILFILFLLINYGLTHVQQYYAHAETAALKRLAYADSLTNLANRAKANEVMEDMDTNRRTACGMLLFDLNNLKCTNDDWGHMAGDTLICAFSEILQEHFAPLGIVARIGGDEFIVLISVPAEKVVKSALDELQKSIDRYNASGSMTPISVAVGTAYSHELSNWDTEKLYRLADERMYACKARMKGVQ